MLGFVGRRLEAWSPPRSTLGEIGGLLVLGDHLIERPGAGNLSLCLSCLSLSLFVCLYLSFCVVLSLYIYKYIITHGGGACVSQGGTCEQLRLLGKLVRAQSLLFLLPSWGADRLLS